MYFPRGSVIAALETGRGRAKQHARARRLRPHDCDIAPVVAGIFLLLIACVVLFVDDDQTEIAYRREDAGARAHHHAGAARDEFCATVRRARNR